MEAEKACTPVQFSRTELLLGPEAMSRLAAARVAVFGLGGVGGHAAEALARSGVGTIDLVDDDCVSQTNINRQLVATLSTVGRQKATVMAERIGDINPECRVTTHTCFYLPQTADQFDFTTYDYVLDAVDTVTAKLQLVQRAHAAHTPIISCMGTANKIDPARLTVADIYDTSICRLARIMRKECRKRGIGHFKVVYSTEVAMKPCKSSSPADAPLGIHDVTRRSIPGSTPFVPPVAGLIMASEVVRDLIAPATLPT